MKILTKRFSIATLLILIIQTAAIGQLKVIENNSSTANPNEWVVAHLDEIHKMTRADWLKLDYPLSKPVYRAFTPMQKEAFWRDKIQEVLALEWSDAERNHINDCWNWIETHRNMFDDSSDKTKQQEAEDFFLKWAAEGVEKFGWPQQLPGAIITSGNRMTNKNGDLIPLKGETCRLQK